MNNLSSSNFDHYSTIIEQYISRIKGLPSTFDYLIEDQRNPEVEKLDHFMKLLNLDLNLPSILTIEKVILSAKFGKIVGYDYSSFKNIAHLILDVKPQIWKHFRLVLKEYGHTNLINEILEDTKINKKKEEINTLNHIYNEYIEFLCPEFCGKLIGWKDQEDIKNPLFETKISSYPNVFFKNLLSEHSHITPGETEKIIKNIQGYIEFKRQYYESIPTSILHTIFKFLKQYVPTNSTKKMDEFYGDFESDIEFKETLNPILDIFNLIYLIQDVSFCDNACVFEFKKPNSSLDDLTYLQKMHDISILKAAANYAKQNINHYYPFYIEWVSS